MRGDAERQANMLLAVTPDSFIPDDRIDVHLARLVLADKPSRHKPHCAVIRERPVVIPRTSAGECVKGTNGEWLRIRKFRLRHDVDSHAAWFVRGVAS